MQPRLSPFMRAVALFVAFLVPLGTAPVSLQAATYYWDGGTVNIGTNGDGLSGGGVGNWNTALTNWDQGNGLSHIAWPNDTGANADIAAFGRTGNAGGTVTLTSPVTVGGLIFYGTGFTVAASTQGLTFDATNNDITLFGSSGTTASAAITGTVNGGGNVSLTSANPVVTGTLTFSGISAGGWTGTTTINSNMILATTTASGSVNKVLNSTSGITLNGGAIQFNRATNAGLGAISDSAAIGVNGGGTFGVTSADAGGGSANETIGAVTVNSGQMNFNWTNGASSGAQMILGASGSGNLVVNGTGAVTFSGNLGSTGRWKVTGAGSTAANEIIGAYATTGAANGIAAQNDYAVYASDFVAAANIGASAESTWTTAHAATSNFTMSAIDSATISGGGRNLNTLRSLNNSVTVTGGNANITLTAHTLAVGDAVVFSAGTMPTGLTAGTTYFVVSTGVNTIQVSATAGGGAITPSTAGATVVASGAIQVSSGNNLGTLGILNGSATTLNILQSGGAGSVTLPTTTAGNLHVTTGSGAINISAPITNNTGALTLVKNGSGGTLTLSGTNTYSGGTVINAGTLSIGNVNHIGGVSANVTFSGNATLLNTTGSVLNFSSGTLTVNQGAVANLQPNVASAGITFATTTGSGNIVANLTQNATMNLGNASTFTGNIQAKVNGNINQNGAVSIQFSSLGDAVGSFLQFGGGQSDGNQSQNIVFNGSAPLVFNNRVVQMLPRTGSNWVARDSFLTNNSASAANTWTINTNLDWEYTTNAGARNLILAGGNTGDNAFNGLLSDGNSGNTPLALSKNDAGRWIVSGSNTYTSITTVTAGTLEVTKLANGGSSSSIGASGSGAGNLILNGGTLRYTGAAVNTDRLFSVGTSSGTLNSSGTGAINFNNTGAMGFNGVTGARTLTLTGTNTGNNTIAANIGDNTGATALAKAGIGTWVLSGSNSATGANALSGGGTLVLDFTTNNNAKLASGVLTVTGGGNLILRAGSAFAQNVTSTTLAAGGGNLSITQDTSGTNTINLNAISRGSANNGATLSLDVDSVATTDNLNNTGGILGGYATVGSNWAKNSTNAVDGAIVGLIAGDYTAMPTTGGSGTVNYQLTGTGGTIGGSLTGNTLRISNNADDQVLNLGASRNLAVSAVGPTGGLLYAGGNNNNYTITGTGTSRLQAQNANQELIINTYTGTLTVEVPILSSASNTNGAFTKSGLGTLVLTATSDFAGGSFVNQGVLRVRNNAALGAVSSGAQSTFVSNGAALELANSVAIGAEALTITGSGVSSGGALRNVASNTSSYAGAITLGAGGARINSDAGGALTLSGGVVTSQFNVVTFGGAGNTTVQTAAISGAGGLVKDSAGTTTLSATNTYTGATSITNGKLTIASTGLINTTSGLTINGATANFRYNSSTNYSAPLTFTQGTLSGTNWGGSLSGLTINTNRTISPGNSPGTATSVTQTWAGGGTYQWEINNTTGTIGLDPGWDWLNLSGALTQTSTSGNKFTIDITGLTTGNVAGAVSNWNPASSSTYIIASAAGGITGFDATGYTLNLANFTNNNTSSGTWSIFQGNGGNGGTVNDILLGYVASGGIPTAFWSGASGSDWGTASNWNTTAGGGVPIGGSPSVVTDVHFSTTTPTAINLGTVNLGANLAVKTLAFDAASSAVTIGSSGGFTLTITPTSSANGINVDTTAGNSILSVKVELGAAQTWTVNANRTLTANGVISGAFGLIKAGSGDLVMGASNTYTGVTQINGGKLKINDLTNLGAGGVGNSVGIDGGTLQSTSNTYALGSNRSIALGGSGGTIDTVSGGVTVDGIVSGTGALTKSGAGILTLSATNTYTGNTNLNAGTINLGAAENAGVSGPLGNQAANAVGTIVMGGGTLQYSANNTFDYSGRFSTAAGQAYNVDTNGQSVIWDTALTSSGGTLTKLGTGTLSLNGTNANTYDGITTVSAGTLDLNKTGATAIAGDLLINGGTVKLIQSEQIANTASITQTSGTFNLNGKTETIVSYTKTGGTFTTGRGGSLIGTGATVTYDGAGTNQIEVDSTVSDSHVVLTNGATLDLAGANAPFDLGPAGTNGGILQISSGGTGLEMNGTAGNTINLASDTTTTTAARIVLDDDVTTGGTGVNTIASTGVGAAKGYVALGASGSRTFTVGDSVSGTGTDLDISAVISSTGAGLTKAGAGTLATSAVNTYTGATSVNAGIFQVGVAGVGSTHADSDVTATSATFTTATTGAGVNANNAAVTGQTVITVGPVVAGSGTIFGDLTIGTNSSNVGVIRPGDVSGSSNGTLTIGGNLVVNNGSQIQMGLASTTQNDAAFNWYVPTGGQDALTYLTSVVVAQDYTDFWDSADGGYDSINATGTLSLGTGGTDYPTHIVSVNPSYTPVLGDIFKLLNWSGVGFHDPDAIGGTHSLPSDLVLPTLGAGFTWDTSAYNGFGVVVVIPEPGRMMLLFFGLAALFLRRRRK